MAPQYPYSEANFKTLKYYPAFPVRSRSVHHVRQFRGAFFDHYNHIRRFQGDGGVWHDVA